ncbi:GTP cyclohydrolase II [Bertholletia excelsa]
MASINITGSASLSSSSKSFKSFRWPSCVQLFSANGCTTNLSLIQPEGNLFSGIRKASGIKATPVTGEGHFSSPQNSISAVKSTLPGDLSAGTEIQPGAIASGTLAAETAPATVSFPVDNDEFDLDRATEGFSSVPEAIEDILHGKAVVVVDDEGRENEGDLIMVASKVRPEDMAFLLSMEQELCVLA